MSYTADSPILGSGRASAPAVQAYFEQSGKRAAPQFAPDRTYKPPPADLGVDICELARQHGVNQDMLAAQIGHESAWWQSRIVRDKNNPSGLGATNDAPYENAITFASPRDGVQATVAHLLSYALGDGSPLRDRSPRHEILRGAGYLGIARVWRDLNGRWAWPGETYAQSIAARANEMIAFAEGRGELTEEAGQTGGAERYGIRGLIDSRHLIATRAGVGPTHRRTLSEKRGRVIIHNAGDRQDLRRSDMQLWQSYAQWHIDRNWARRGSSEWIHGNGIMYHIGIGRNGEKHLLYDIEVDRWHCNAWPENGSHLAINLPIGGDQRATPAALAALTEVVDDWLAGGPGGKEMVKGHREVDPGNDCPGELMAQFVFPYREGVMTTERGKWFPQTSCYIGGEFWEYWNSNGGLMMFGYPLTDEVDEDGRTVQYFERAVFEWHPENQAPYRVLLRLLGAEALERKRTS